MDPKYFISILFCGLLSNNIFSSGIEASTTEKPVQPTIFSSSMPNVLANSQNTSRNPLTLPTQFNNLSSGQPRSLAKVTAGEPIPVALASSGKPAVQSSTRPPLPYNTITQSIPPVANTSPGQTALSEFTSARQSPIQSTSASTQQASPPVHISSTKPVPPTAHDLATRLISTVKNSQRITPGFTFDATTNKKTSHKTNSNSTAAILIGIILTFMMIVIIMIVLWKCLRKPVLNDQNWAGRSPFADGETPDLCMDNIRENEVPTKRTSIASLIAWKPSKSTLSADNLEIKLFESNENIEDSNSLKTEKTKDQVNGASEDSADGSTIGTAVSLSDDADLPPPPPLQDLEGQENVHSVTPTMTIPSPLPNDSTNLLPSLDCLNQACEDQTSSLSPDSPNLPLPPADFVKSQGDCNSEVQCQEFSIPLDYAQDLNESLPLPPAELL
ncbi:protein EVI2B isoform X2 [Oryctolagus cuniculus]|nr:protein EVI2B isoform X2 [Oryctolagus cuniculus]